LTCRRFHPVFVGEFFGADASGPLASAALSVICDAIDQYAALIFRGNDIDDKRQLAFTRHFGEIGSPLHARSGTKRRPPEISDLS